MGGMEIFMMVETEKPSGTKELWTVSNTKSKQSP